MLYKWKDSKTGTEVWVSRSMKEYNRPPTQEESEEAGLGEEDYKKAVFVKIITGGAFTKGFSGPNTGKGYWILLFSLLSGGCTQAVHAVGKNQLITEKVLNNTTQHYPIYRVENSEVVCYLAYDTGFQCKFKEQK